ncbi:T9SS type A sorting domain-containing protein [Calditrichota bacterium]
MNKFLQIFCVFLLTGIMFASDAVAQEFNNGTIGINIAYYGRVRIFGSTLDVQQIDRSSILVGYTADQVFDYHNDAEIVDPGGDIVSPAFSDYEAYISIDNSYNIPTFPPDVLVKINAYGWDAAGFVIVKFRVLNMESSNWNSTLIGMEVIPRIDHLYGFETVDWVVDKDVMEIYSDPSTHIGYKVLNDPLASLTTFDWYSGYNNLDSDLWGWLNYAGFDTTYECLTADGTVSVFKQGGVDIAAGDSTEMYVGIAIGSNSGEMLANMDSAVAKYDEIFGVSTVLGDNFVPSTFELEQNFPNPFNPSTKIKFDLPTAEKTHLVVSNMLGQEVVTLVNDQLTAGSYEIEFNASDLPSGIYFYTLQAGNLKITKKMVFLK